MEVYVIFELKLELSSLELHWHWCVAGASSAASIAVGFSAHQTPLTMRSMWFSLEVLVWSYSQIPRACTCIQLSIWLCIEIVAISRHLYFETYSYIILHQCILRDGLCEIFRTSPCLELDKGYKVQQSKIFSSF